MTFSPDPAPGSFRVDAGALDILCALLSPDEPIDGRATFEDYVVLRGRAQPRYLLPAAIPRAAGAALARPGSARNAQTILVRLALPLLTRLGGIELRGWHVRLPTGVDGAPSLPQRIAEHLGLHRVHVAAAIGPPRPNRKPVLQIFDGAGETVCFAKLGVDGLTSRLVRHEAAFLAEHRFGPIVAPELIAITEWKGLPLALYRPLPLRRARRRDPLSTSANEILAIAQSCGIEKCDALDSPWWLRISQELMPFDDEVPVAHTLAKVATRLEGVRWRFGAWHGDFAPWNAQRIDGTLHVWDWERAGAPAPLGLDPVHAWFQVATLRNGLPPAAAAQHATTVNPGLLHQLGVQPQDQRTLVDCYQLELCLRLAEAARSGEVAPLTDAIRTMVLAIADRAERSV